MIFDGIPLREFRDIDFSEEIMFAYRKQILEEVIQFEHDNQCLIDISNA